MDMDYISLIIGFNRWTETNYLPKDAQLLWFKMIELFNKAGWSEWIRVDNQRLMSLIQIKRESTFIEIRDKLIENNFFEFRKREKELSQRIQDLYFQF